MADQPGYDPVFLKQMLEQQEGRKATLYHDTRGILSGGIGHNFAIPMTDYVIDAIYENDVIGCYKSLDIHLPWWRGLDPVRQSVLMSMVFNLGFAGLSQFKNTLAAIEAGHYLAASQGMLNSLWAKQVGNRAKVLAAAMASGHF